MGVGKISVLLFCSGTPAPGEFIFGGVPRELMRIYPSADPFSFSQQPFDNPAQTFEVRKNGVTFLQVVPDNNPGNIDNPPCIATNVWNNEDFPAFVEFNGTSDIISFHFTGPGVDSTGRDMAVSLLGLRESDWP